MPFHRQQEIYTRLREKNLDGETWSLFAELHNLQNLHPDLIAAELRRAKDRERKKHSESNSVDSTESPIIILDNNIISKGGVGGNKSTNSAESPKAILGAVLDAEHAAAVVEHRQKLRKPLTPRAAKALAKALEKAPNPNEAAEAMLARGWAGFDVAWLKNGRDQPGIYKPLPPRKRDWAEIKAERENQDSGC
jgi:hypothetical protein